MGTVIVEKGAYVDAAKCKDLQVHILDFAGATRKMGPDAGGRFIEALPKDQVLPLIHYVRSCNVALAESPYYETGARVRFQRGGKRFTYYGNRFGYRVEED